MGQLFSDTHVWYAMSFGIFAVVAWIFARKAITGTLDARIAEIRAEIKTAENLYAEATQLLAEYQAKHHDAGRDAEKIKSESEQNAEKIRERAEAALAVAMERRERQLEDRLARMKQSAISEIQQYAADIAAQATAEIIARQLDKAAGEKLIDRSIARVGEKLH